MMDRLLFVRPVMGVYVPVLVASVPAKTAVERDEDCAGNPTEGQRLRGKRASVVGPERTPPAPPDRAARFHYPRSALIFSCRPPLAT